MATNEVMSINEVPEEAQMGHESNESLAESDEGSSGSEDDADLDDFTAVLDDPYPTKTTENSLNTRMLRSIVAEVTTKVNIMGLRLLPKGGADLKDLLFGVKESFSKMRGTFDIANTKDTRALGVILPFPLSQDNLQLATVTIAAVMGALEDIPTVHLPSSLRNKEPVDVAAIKPILMGLASPPWILHEECEVAKGGLMEVPHGRIDMIIGRKTDNGTTQAMDGIVVDVTDRNIPMEPSAIISAKTRTAVKKKKPTERQVVLELLAFSEVVRANGTAILIRATRTRFKLYFYIRPLDLLFRSPSFQFRGGTKTSLTALVVLYSVLNMDYRGFYKRLLGTKGVCCGWAEALRLSGASFRNSVLVQKKNNTPPCSGASSEQNTPNRDPYVKVLLSQMQYAKRVKRDSD